MIRKMILKWLGLTPTETALTEIAAGHNYVLFIHRASISEVSSEKLQAYTELCGARLKIVPLAGVVRDSILVTRSA